MGSSYWKTPEIFTGAVEGPGFQHPGGVWHRQVPSAVTAAANNPTDATCQDEMLAEMLLVEAQSSKPMTGAPRTVSLHLLEAGTTSLWS